MTPVSADAHLPDIDLARAHTLVLEPSRGWRAINLRELWAYRELLYIFAWRDLKVRYRQTLLGAMWVIGQPLLTMVIFTVLFHRVAKFDAGAIPYPLFVLSGIVLWNFFSAAVLKAGNSLIGASYLISKVYFPRLLVPLANVVVELADFCVASLLLAILLGIYRYVPSAQIVVMPLAVIAAGLLGIGLALWLAALNVEYRDIQVLVPFVMQLSMYVTPVVYPLKALPENLRRLAPLNPMTGIIETFRAGVFGTPIPWTALGWSYVLGVLFFITGLYYFRRMERVFVDIL